MKFKNILNSKFMMTVLLLPFFEPSGTEEMAEYLGGGWTYLHMTFLVMKLISFVIIAFFSFYQLGRPTDIFLYMLAFQIWILVMTTVNGGLTFSRFMTSLTSIGAVLLFDYYVRVGNTKKFISVAESILMILILINLITVIAYPNGMYANSRNWRQNWILGYRNLHIQFFLPYLVLCGIKQSLKKGKIGIRFFAMILVIIITSYFCQSLTSLIATLFIGVLVIFIGSKNLPKMVNMVTIYIVSLVISLLIIFMGVQNYFRDFFENVLGKDVSMSSRTLIWEQGIIYFLKKPFMGNGIVSIGYSTGYRDYTINQMHNMYFDILVVGGIVLLVIYTLMIFLVNSKISSCKNIVLRNIALFIFVGYVILFITEARRNLALFNVFMFLLYYLPQIVELYNLEECSIRIIKFRIGRKN